MRQKRENMVLLYARALGQLLRFEGLLLRGEFALLHQRVRDYPCFLGPPSKVLTDRVCMAMDMVCIWYPKQVLCLQRSAATACLLRKYGLPAQLVIGTQKLPFKAHAWVELENSVVNDKLYMQEIYIVLDRC
jgi:transglutaminase superfamily protein